MYQGHYLVVLASVLCTVSCLKVFPIEGTTVTLSSGFKVKPSPVLEPTFTTEDQNIISPFKATILPPEATTTLEGTLSTVKIQPSTVLFTIEPTPKLASIKIEPDVTTSEVFGAIVPTSVFKIDAAQTYDIPAENLLPPKK